MKQPVMGIQLYTLREHIQTAEDFDKTLSRLSAMGVRDVQISGIGDIPAEEQRDILQKNQMKVCVTHKSLDRLKNDADALMDEHEVIGCDAIGLGSAPGDARGNRANVRGFIGELNAIGAKLKERGFSFHYHNHAFEFVRLDDMKYSMMDLLLKETDPSCVNFIPDVAWIHFGGEDPVEIMRRMAGRVKVIHFKDYAFDEEGVRHFVPLGQGIVDLEACYRAACELEIPYIMYEHDSDWPDNDPFKACEESWQYMMKLQNSFGA